MRKIKRIAKFEGLEPRRCEDIKGIVVPDIGPKSFGTFEKQAPELHADDESSVRSSAIRGNFTSGRRPLGSLSSVLKVPNVRHRRR